MLNKTVPGVTERYAWAGEGGVQLLAAAAGKLVLTGQVGGNGSLLYISDASTIVGEGGGPLSRG